MTAERKKNAKNGYDLKKSRRKAEDSTKEGEGHECIPSKAVESTTKNWRRGLGGNVEV
jgi:hypothetical protein